MSEQPDSNGQTEQHSEARETIPLHGPVAEDRGSGGYYLAGGPRREARLIGRAIREGWEIPANMARDAIRTMHDIIVHSKQESRQIGAARVLASVYNANLTAEAIESRERQGELALAASMIKATLTNDAKRELLAKLSDGMCPPPDPDNPPAG